MGTKKVTSIAVGDMFITRKVAEKGYPGFGEISDLIGRHDVAFANLEMTFHNQEGWPAAESGGTWAMTEPDKLDDVKRFGFNLFNTANNHSGDYGQEGVMATIRHLRERGMIFSGSGANLQEASRPCYLETPDYRVALISVSSSFSDASRAGGQSGEMAGRPGLNPLRYSMRYHVDPENFAKVKELAAITRVNMDKDESIALGYSAPYEEGIYPFGSAGNFVLDTKNFIESVPNAQDMKRITDQIREAKRQADLVYVSLHAHEHDDPDTSIPAQFIETFAHQVIDAGADVMIGHGPHELRGIEIYKGKVILYSLGNFVFQTETVSLQPYDAVYNKHLPLDMPVGAYMSERSKNGTAGYGVMKNIWRSVMAGWTVEDGRITEVELYPVSLGLKAVRPQKGWPVLSHDQDTLSYLAHLSEPYGTSIRIRDGVGTIEVN